MGNVSNDNMLWPTVVALPKRSGWSLWGELWGDAPKLQPERVAKEAVARVATLATWNPAA